MIESVGKNMAFTKKDLQKQVDYLNERYFKNSVDKLVVDQAYGGYQVNLTGKRNKDGSWKKHSTGSGRKCVTYGYLTAREVSDKLDNLEYRDEFNYLRKEEKKRISQEKRRR